MDVPDVKPLRELESENSRLERLLADAMLDNEGLNRPGNPGDSGV